MTSYVVTTCRALNDMVSSTMDMVALAGVDPENLGGDLTRLSSIEQIICVMTQKFTEEKKISYWWGGFILTLK